MTPGTHKIYREKFIMTKQQGLGNNFFFKDYILMLYKPGNAEYTINNECTLCENPLVTNINFVTKCKHE